jgi:hypothetical protein
LSSITNNGQGYIACVEEILKWMEEHFLDTYIVQSAADIIIGGGPAVGGPVCDILQNFIRDMIFPYMKNIYILSHIQGAHSNGSFVFWFNQMSIKTK